MSDNRWIKIEDGMEQPTGWMWLALNNGDQHRTDIQNKVFFKNNPHITHYFLDPPPDPPPPERHKCQAGDIVSFEEPDGTFVTEQDDDEILGLPRCSICGEKAPGKD